MNNSTVLGGGGGMVFIVYEIFYLKDYYTSLRSLRFSYLKFLINHEFQYVLIHKKFSCPWDKINDNMHKLRGIIYEYMNSKILL